MKTKLCSQCKRNLTLDSFDFANRSMGKKHSACKICRGKQGKKYYEMNIEERIAYSLKNNKKRVTRNQLFLIGYLKNHPCIDCGEDDIRVLEFDHRNGESKLLGVTKLVSLKYSIKRIEDEIAKCDVRCANCHRKKTVEELDWYRGR